MRHQGRTPPAPPWLPTFCIWGHRGRLSGPRQPGLGDAGSDLACPPSHSPAESGWEFGLNFPWGWLLA